MPLTVLLTSMSGDWPMTVTSSSIAPSCEADVQLDRLFELDDDPVADDGLESLEGEGDPVGAGREGEEAIDAVVVGDGRGLADEFGAGGFDGDAGKRRPLLVGDGAEHLAGRHLGEEVEPDSVRKQSTIPSRV